MFTIDPSPPPLDPHLAPTAASRPGTVTAAGVLMWLHFATALCIPAALAMTLLLRLSDVESGPIGSSEAGYFGLVAGLFLLCGAAFYTLVGILAVKLLHRRRWARSITLVLNGLVSFSMLIASGPALLSGVPGSALAVIALEGAIAACLCSPSARRWFSDDPSETPHA